MLFFILESLKLQISRVLSSKGSLDIQATIECGLTLKRVRDMIRTYNQMHRSNLARLSIAPFSHLVKCTVQSFGQIG